MDRSTICALHSIQRRARTVGCRIVAASLACAAFVTAAQAQSPAQRISHTATCGECRIEVKKVLTIGSANDEVLAGNVAPLARNRRGQFFAVAHDRFQFIVYNSDGKYASAIGRRGQGPGEFSAQLGISHLTVDRHEIRLDGAPGLSVDVTNVPWLQASKRDTTIAGRGGRPVVMQVGGGSVDPAGYTADGLLWISGGMPPAGGRAGNWSYGIDVFDPTTRRILVSTATPRWLTFMADGYASSLEVDDDGVMTFSLWQVQFHDARKPQ